MKRRKPVIVAATAVRAEAECRVLEIPRHEAILVSTATPDSWQRIRGLDLVEEQIVWQDGWEEGRFAEEIAEEIKARIRTVAAIGPSTPAMKLTDRFPVGSLVRLTKAAGGHVETAPPFERGEVIQHDINQGRDDIRVDTIDSGYWFSGPDSTDDQWCDPTNLELIGDDGLPVNRTTSVRIEIVEDIEDELDAGFTITHCTLVIGRSTDKYGPTRIELDTGGADIDLLALVDLLRQGCSPTDTEIREVLA